MAPYVGILRAAGLAKENTVGTLVTPPTKFIRYIPPDSFYPSIKLLESMGIQQLPDMVVKVSQGPRSLTSGKVKVEVEPEAIGEMLMATFGTDTPAETASFIVSAGVNDKIDFKENGGSQLHATLTTGTYTVGTSSSQAGTLCALIKTQLEAVSGGHTYTITYSYSTKKFTIAINTTTIQILWLTGTNTATNAHTLLGFSNVDTSNSASLTSDSTSQQFVFGHTFTRLAASQLPTYSWWFDKGAKYPQFTGCMMNKFEINAKAGGFVEAEADWTGLGYDDTGSSQSPTYSALKPFNFNKVTISVDSVGNLNYDDLKITIDNNVKADHGLNGSLDAAKIYSEGLMVTLSAQLFFEDTTQYAKFLAGTSAAFVITMNSVDNVVGAIPYSLVFNIPAVYYQSANLINPKGLLKLPFIGRAVYDVSTTKTINAVLTNSVNSTY